MKTERVDVSKRTLAAVTLLLVLSMLVQAWCVARAAVPAQDSVRYVAIAQNIERQGFVAAWRDESEHPLFPALIYAVHSARTISSRSPAVSWGLSAQLASTAMLVLAVVPVYLLLRRLAGDAAGFVAAVFFCVLPEVARLGADALSDSTQLFFISVALWSLAKGWGTWFSVTDFSTDLPPESTTAPAGTGAIWLLLCGASLGLAMLARPEAMVVAGSVPLALVLFQMRAAWRETWGRWIASLGCFAAGMLIVLPYLYIGTSGQVAHMPARLLGRDTPTPTIMTLADVAAAPRAPSPTQWRLANGEPMAFGGKDRSVSSRFQGYPSAIAEFFEELPAAFHYWIGAWALVGIASLCRHSQRKFDCFGMGLFVLHSVAAIHLASQLGYLSARHLLTLVVLGLAPAGWGVCRMGRWLSDRWSDGAARRELDVGWRFPRDAAYATALLAVLSASACLPETLAVLHPSRAGHRQAGHWLAAAGARGVVLDTRGWTSLYSRRETIRYDAAKAAYQRADLAYVVVEQRDLQRNSPRSRTLRHLLGGAAERVASFSAPRGKPEDTVIVYRWNAKRFANLMSMAPKKV